MFHHKKVHYKISKKTWRCTWKNENPVFIGKMSSLRIIWGWGGLEQYKLLSSGSESDKMKEDNALNFYKTRNSNSIIVKIWLDLKGTLLGLRQFLATESPTKMMKSAFYFTKKALRETT